MSLKKWVNIYIIMAMITISFVGFFNFIIDPYGLFNNNYFKLNKIKKSEKMRLIKAIETSKLKPASIILGTSRAEGGYDPSHEYFRKPSYNLAVSASSMFESRLYFENALKYKNLKQVLLVADYMMFNSLEQKSVNDFESYFSENFNIYKFLFSKDTLNDSIKTINAKNNIGIKYYSNGQRLHDYAQNDITRDGGHLKVMNKSELEYYKQYTSTYTYKNTGKKSFDDFEKIVKLCYENNITLDIVFGPSHIRQWEALDYYLGYEKWLKWKKDVLLSVYKIAKEYKKKEYRIVDFSIYHQLTSENIPQDKNINMEYHWESSHYKNRLGLIVLDRLINKSKFENFGVELNDKNIDEHLVHLKKERKRFINTTKYQESVFLKLKE